MKILWFVQPDFNPSNKKNCYNGVGWIMAIQKELVKRSDISLCMSYWGKTDSSFQEGGVFYYQMEEPKMPIWEKIKCRINTGYICEEKYLWGAYRNKMKEVIKAFSPDIIHIFGSENKYGLISGFTKVPVVIHLQGILNPYYMSLLPPFVSKYEYIFKDGLRIGKVLRNLNGLYAWKKMIFCEKEILKNTDFFFGRTVWDYRISNFFNNQAKYMLCGEILRAPFYIESKRINPQKLTIASTISSPLYKGFDLILKTAKILSDYKIDFNWYVFGNTNVSLIERIFHIRHESVNVHLLGVATANQIKECLLSSTVYVHPSYIDNSPNSVCEAQICGLPIIATNVGGVNSIVNDGENGFLVPSNDPYQTAYLINLLYIDNTLNKKMGISSQEVARNRHDKTKIINQLIDGYHQMV